MKRAVERVLMAFVILAALGAAQVTIAGETSPCEGMIKNLSEKNKADLEDAIAKQLNSPEKVKVSSVALRRVLASHNWSIIHVAPPRAEDVVLFYAGNPLTSRYVTVWATTMWADAMFNDDEPKIKAWVLKNAPGIPPKLASCFAWYVKNAWGRSGK